MQNILWTDRPLAVDCTEGAGPARERAVWEQSAYPLGNGRLGCTVFGAPQRERIQFNQDSLWVGNEDNTGGYQPFGDVYVEFDEDARNEEDEDHHCYHYGDYGAPKYRI